MKLNLIRDRLTVCRLSADAVVPTWAATAAGFSSITRTDEELSIVCVESVAPKNVKQEPGWRALKLAGPLDFGLTGILASIATPLAQAGISIFAVSTYDTDYILVKATLVDTATQVLRAAGHTVPPE